MNTEELLERLATSIERGKATKEAPFPPDLEGQDGAAELTEQLLAQGIGPTEILSRALMIGMNRIGDEYSQGRAFVPELLLSARAMNASMAILKPLFTQEDAPYRGSLVIGTVEGDLHDIGKNIVRMVLEGGGWQVIDLGVDVTPEKFLDALREHPNSMVGISAMLTTTMINMEASIRKIKEAEPGTKVFVGGAPLSTEFNDRIGADGYFPDPQALARHLAVLAK